MVFDSKYQAMALDFAGLALALGLVACNAFFVAAEFAIVKVRHTRLQELAGQGVRSARSSMIMVDHMDEYLSATQLGITLVSLALGWVGEEAFSGLLTGLWPEGFAEATGRLHFLAIGLSFFIITLLHVVLGELVPKSMAIQQAEKITLFVARPLRLFYGIARPLIRTFTWLANFVLKRLGYNGMEGEPLTEAELKLVMKESREEGVISESEAQIINRAFEFSDKRASDILIPAARLDVLSLDQDIEENLGVVKRHMRTRFPLCKSKSGGLDSIIGVVHMKDAWPMLSTERSNAVFERCARPVIFVESGMREDRLMKLSGQLQMPGRGDDGGHPRGTRWGYSG